MSDVAVRFGVSGAWLHKSVYPALQGADWREGLACISVDEMVIPGRVFAPHGQRGRTCLGATTWLHQQSGNEVQVA